LETSAKTAMNVEEAFNDTARDILKKIDEGVINVVSSPPRRLEQYSLVRSTPSLATDPSCSPLSPRFLQTNEVHGVKVGYHPGAAGSSSAPGGGGSRSSTGGACC
jgi:hypothetical protein